MQGMHNVLRTSKNDHGLPRDPFKAIVSPRPVGWITSMSANGEINLAPYSFFNAVSDARRS
jgi:flavin reductase (DIM6/NTAB) family NADH-FMN oxidoreductase RutF